MNIIKLGSRIVALGVLLIVAPSVGHPMNGLPHRPQIGFIIQPSENQLTDPVSSIYLASFVRGEATVSVKPRARSTLATLFDALFGRRHNMSRPKAAASIMGRKSKPESNGPKLEETLVTQQTVAPHEKAASLTTPAATPTAASPPPIAPILSPSSSATKVNDLQVLPLE
jgi:hypothetical protein